MPIKQQEILSEASSRLAEIAADLTAQRDELLHRPSSGNATGAEVIARVIDSARKMHDIMVTAQQKGDQV